MSKSINLLKSFLCTSQFLQLTCFSSPLLHISFFWDFKSSSIYPKSFLSRFIQRPRISGLKYYSDVGIETQKSEPTKRYFFLSFVECLKMVKRRIQCIMRIIFSSLSFIFLFCFSRVYVTESWIPCSNYNVTVSLTEVQMT